MYIVKVIKNLQDKKIGQKEVSREGRISQSEIEETIF